MLNGAVGAAAHQMDVDTVAVESVQEEVREPLQNEVPSKLEYEALHVQAK